MHGQMHRIAAFVQRNRGQEQTVGNAPVIQRGFH